MNPSARHLLAPLTIAATAAGLSFAGPALAAPVHANVARIAPRPHLTSQTANAAPGQENIPVTLPAATYNVTPTSKLTLAAALQEAPPNSVIHLAGGTYPAIFDKIARAGEVVVSGEGDATEPMIDGAGLWGSTNLAFVGVEFTSSVEVNYAPVARYARTAKNISLIDSQIDCGSDGSLEHGVAHGNTGILVRGASQGVTLEGDYVHNCTVGFASISQDEVSSNVTLAHDTFTDFSGDAIDLGGLQGTVIDDNIIGDATHAGAEAVYHNDGIQFFGNTTNTNITNNVLQNSGGQLLFIQDAVQSNTTGSSVNSNILVQNNLIYGAGAYAVQDQGGENVSFIGNTIWDSHWGGLLIRQSGYTGIIPTDTTIEDNVLSGYATQNVTPDNEHNNLVYGPLSPKMKAMVSPTDVLGATPDFADASTGDFQLTGITPAATTQAPVAPTATATAGASTAAPASTPASTATTVAPPSGLGSTLVGSFGAPQYGPAS